MDAHGALSQTGQDALSARLELQPRLASASIIALHARPPSIALLRSCCPPSPNAANESTACLPAAAASAHHSSQPASDSLPTTPSCCGRLLSYLIRYSELDAEPSCPRVATTVCCPRPPVTPSSSYRTGIPSSQIEYRSPLQPPLLPTGNGRPVDWIN